VLALLPSQQAPAAEKDQKKVKTAKKLPDIPGLDSSLFKQAMTEQKSHGLMMKGAKIGRSVSLFKIHNHACTGEREKQVSVCNIVSDCVRDCDLQPEGVPHIYSLCFSKAGRAKLLVKTSETL
jgi:hypothetical protein